MDTIVKRNIKSGKQFDHFFPRANRINQVVLSNAHLWDTMDLIPKVVGGTLAQTFEISKELYDKDVYKCCRKIWQFVYDHIDYHKDEPGAEQVRSPARAWTDRFEGVDCDCYSVFISSILSNLGIPHVLRITKYSANTFQHIYPVALTQDRNEIIIDCVTEFFDHEVPYSEKKDYPMQLQYLNGLDCVPVQKKNNNPDYLDFDEDDLEGAWEGKKDGLGIFTLDNWQPAIDDGGAYFDPAFVPDIPQPLQLNITQPSMPLQPWQPDPAFTPAPSPVPASISTFTPAQDTNVVMPNIETVSTAPTTVPAAISLLPSLSTPKGVRGATCTCTLNDEEMGSIFSKIGNFISTNVKSAVNDVSNAVQDVAQFADQNVKSTVKDVSNIATSVKNFGVQNIKSAANDVANAAQDVSKFVAQNVESGIKDAGKIGQQVIDFVKKLSPLMILARMGLRTGLKLNLFNTARRLRWGFVDQEYLAQYDISEEWHGKVSRLVEKVIKAYEDMGGDKNHVRDAIMNGKGNSVNPIDPSTTLAGFGYLPSELNNAKYLNVNMPISQILGPEEYQKEMQVFRSLSGLGGLGELGMDPATATALAAAATALAAIAHDLMTMGSQGAGKGAAAQDMDPRLATSPEYTVQDASVQKEYNDAMAKLAVTGTGTNYALPDTSGDDKLSESAKQFALNYLQNESKPLDVNNPTGVASYATPSTNSTYTNPLYQTVANTTPAPPAPKEPGFFEKYKTPLIIIGSVSVVGIGALIYLAHKKKKKEQEHKLNGFRRPLNDFKKKNTRRIKI